jgi:hypothetical protein
LVLFAVLVRIITKLICEVRSLLFVNDALVKVISRRVLVLSGMNYSSFEALSCCYLRRLLSALISSFPRFIDCTADNKLNVASG